MAVRSRHRTSALGRKRVEAMSHKGWFLATHREPRVPRAFTRLDVAVRLARRLFKVPTITVCVAPDRTRSAGSP